MAALFLTTPFGASGELFSMDMCNAEAILPEDKQTPGKKISYKKKYWYFSIYSSSKVLKHGKVIFTVTLAFSVNLIAYL